MKLTPLDIRHKEFKRTMRGYADVEVDEFLDEVADEYERIFKENIDLQEKVEALEEKVSGYQRIEETLQKTLLNAQASAEEQKQNAMKQAQLILQDAELKARQMVNDAYTERQSVEQAIAKLRGAEKDFRFKFRQLLEGYVQQLGTPLADEAEEPAATGGDDAEFTRRAEAIKEAIAREAAPSPAMEQAPAAPAAAEPAPKPPADAAAAAPQPGPPQAAATEPARQAPAAAAVMTKAGETPAPEAKPEPAVTVRRAAPDETPVERIIFGEGDDLLADVDSGVNENEFKW